MCRARPSRTVGSRVLIFLPWVGRMTENAQGSTVALRNWLSVKADRFFVSCPRGPETSTAVSTLAKPGHLPHTLTTASQSPCAMSSSWNQESHQGC